MNRRWCLNFWWARVNDRELAVSGENPGSAFVKATLSPGELSNEDAAVLDVYYRSVVSGWLNMIRTWDVTGIDRNWYANVQWQAQESFAADLEELARLIGVFYLNPPMSICWNESPFDKGLVEDKFVEFVNEAVKSQQKNQ